MNNLIVRSIAGIIFSVAVAGSAYLGPTTFGLLFLFFAVVGLYEIYELLHHKEAYEPRWLAGISTGIAIYILLFLSAANVIEQKWLWIIALMIPVMFCVELFRRERTALSNLAVTIFGWVYVIVPLALINYLPVINGQFEFEIPIGFFLILWANDTGAYFVGKFLGRTKLFESVSPNKTWEGLFGGVVACVLVAYALSTFLVAIDRTDWLVMALLVSVFGNLGDLFESHLKRNYGVKDSGHIIPGHGGVMDRFDGLFLTLPVLIFYFKIIL